MCFACLCLPKFRTIVRRKEDAMLIAIFSIAGFLLVRGVMAALASLRGLPRSNEDWIYY